MFEAVKFVTICCNSNRKKFVGKEEIIGKNSNRKIIPITIVIGNDK